MNASPRFLPDYYLDLERTNGLERAKKLGVADVRNVFGWKMSDDRLPYEKGCTSKHFAGDERDTEPFDRDSELDLVVC